MFPDSADSVGLKFFRQSVADLAALDLSLPPGFIEQMRECDRMNRIATDFLREQDQAIARAKSVFPDLAINSRTDFLPFHRRSETEELRYRAEELSDRTGELSGRIEELSRRNERLEKLLNERIPDPNAPVEPFPHKETGFHTTGQ